MAWGAFIVGLGIFLLYPILVSTNFMFLFGKSPGLEELENPKVEKALRAIHFRWRTDWDAISAKTARQYHSVRFRPCW